MKNAQKSGGKAKIQPLGDRVLIKAIDENLEKTKSGIYIPDTVKKDKPAQGKVVAVGAGIYREGKLMPLHVNVGDTVMFSKYGYDELKVDGEEYLMLKEENILAIIK